MTTKQRLLVANWKMNHGIHSANEFIETILPEVQKLKNSVLWIAPSYTLLPHLCHALNASGILVGSQNVHYELNGAFTGEVSATQIKECGASFTLAGHSERRQGMGESIEESAKRALTAVQSGLRVIFCIGETLAARQAGRTNLVLQQQLEPFLSRLSSENVSRVVIAYEPVWAIGTGVAASLEEIEESHATIFSLAGKEVPILYGGSVNAENFADIIQIKNVSGALVGKASLSALSFLELSKIAENIQ